MIIFPYGQKLNRCFSEGVAATQQDLIYLESRATCNIHKIKTRQQRSHSRHLEEA